MEFAVEAQKLLEISLEGFCGIKIKNMLTIENLHAQVDGRANIKRY